MKRLSLLLPALTLALASIALATPALAETSKVQARLTEPQLREDMRKLWEDHVTYTAFFYTAVINGGDDAGKLAARLLRNQDDIGNAVKPFYGEGGGNKLSALLRDHILVAADVVAAAKAGDAPGLQKASKRWTANADELAAFLSSANPHWPRKTLADALQGHLAMTTDAVVAKLNKDTAGAIAAFDKGREHMLGVADVLSAGLVKQFPARFAP